MFEGTFTALVTPCRDDRLDEQAFSQLIEDQIQKGITGIVPVGTTGESPTLDHSEHRRVIELAVKTANGRCKVIAGTGSNSTTEAVDLTQEAERLGADAALLVAPYYNRPTQEGLFLHYSKIAEATKLPLMLYSIPGRCGIEISVETTQRLASSCPNIVAIKEAGGVTERVRQLRAALPAEFEILSGDDALTVDFMKEGAVGVVSVAGNLIPGPMADLTRAMLEGRLGDAEAIHAKYAPLFNAFLKIDTNPVPIKAALGLTGACRPKLRLPMVEMSAAKVEELRSTLLSVGLL
jgi:4-hydroxy-tetrahydrodipicolinate synthase